MTAVPPSDATACVDDSVVEARRLVLMGQIAAGVSHELNNVLGKIIALLFRNVPEDVEPLGRFECEDFLAG